MKHNKNRERRAHSSFRDMPSLHTLDQSPVYRRRRQPAHDALNIITHLRKRVPANNPEPALSYWKQVPKEDTIARERSEMISHPSKVSRDVPIWFKGQTYKFYKRDEYDTLNRIQNYIPYDYDVRSQSGSERSERSMRGSQVSESPNFYFGTGRQEPHIARGRMKKESKPLADKIGSLETRDFVLPRVPVKIGHSEIVNTYKP